MVFLKNGSLHSLLFACVVNSSSEVLYVAVCLPLSCTPPVGRKNVARTRCTVRSTFCAAVFKDQ